MLGCLFQVPPRALQQLLARSELLHRPRMGRQTPAWTRELLCSHLAYPQPLEGSSKGTECSTPNWLTYLTHLSNCYYTCWLITSPGNQRGHKFDTDLCKPAALQMSAGSGGLSGAWEKWGTGNVSLWKCPSLPHQPTAAVPCPNKMGSGEPRSHGEPPAPHAWGASTALPAPSAFLSTD